MTRGGGIYFLYKSHIFLGHLHALRSNGGQQVSDWVDLGQRQFEQAELQDTPGNRFSESVVVFATTRGRRRLKEDGTARRARVRMCV